jgi:hypothetical protein
MNLWHLRFGHLGVEDLKLLAQRNVVDVLSLEIESKLSFCQGCVLGKQHKESFPKEGATMANEILGLVHNNIWGPTKTPFLEGARYFIMFIDDAFQKPFCYFMKTRGECFSKFMEFKVFAENQIGKKF